MAPRSTRPALGAIALSALALTFSVYFVFAAVQGDYGLFRRAEIDAEVTRLEAELSVLSAEVARMENLTLRLSDHALDLDLLDEQARDVLGLVRVDEVVVQ